MHSFQNARRHDAESSVIPDLFIKHFSRVHAISGILASKRDHSKSVSRVRDAVRNRDSSIEHLCVICWQFAFVFLTEKLAGFRHAGSRQFFFSLILVAILKDSTSMTMFVGHCEIDVGLCGTKSEVCRSSKQTL